VILSVGFVNKFLQHFKKIGWGSAGFNQFVTEITGNNLSNPWMILRFGKLF